MREALNVLRGTLGLLTALVLAACATPPTTPPPGATPATRASGALNRLTWGANRLDAERLANLGWQAYVHEQTQPQPNVALPAPAQQAIAALSISQMDGTALGLRMEEMRRAADARKDDAQKKAAQQAYQQELSRLAREAASRHVLRALYSPAQVQEQMVWFWMNHFSVHQYKHNLRALLGDYEDRAVRSHALGRFRTLLGAVTLHPAMLRYLDNDQNAVGRVNENLARELMELHTLGVDGGYTQKDVQELARVLTGVGVNLGADKPAVRKELAAQYVRRGLMEFHPQRHDSTPKVLLGQPVAGTGLAELDNALDRLAEHPATARFISRKLATFWLADAPSPGLVAAMAQTWERTQGDIGQVLRTLFLSDAFVQAPPTKFKDPMRYVVSAVRLAYNERVVLNTAPVLNWLNRLGEPLYGRVTPDGYPLTAAGWNSAGQLTTRFEVAKAIGSGSAGLFKTEGPSPSEQPAFPQLANALYYQAIEPTLSAPTRQALAQATSAQEWSTLLLASPEFMQR